MPKDIHTARAEREGISRDEAKSLNYVEAWNDTLSDYPDDLVIVKSDGSKVGIVGGRRDIEYTNKIIDALFDDDDVVSILPAAECVPQESETFLFTKCDDYSFLPNTQIDAVSHKSGKAPIKKSESKPSRNEKCICGSGRKFKHCCISTYKYQYEEEADGDTG